MSAVVADTHSAVWMLFSPERLSADARSALKGAMEASEPIYLASVSVVEVVYLVERGRLQESVFDRLINVLLRPDSGLTIVPLDLAVSQAVRRVSRAEVPELPDRIIAATALYLGLPLVTRDLRLRAAGVPTIW